MKAILLFFIPLIIWVNTNGQTQVYSESFDSTLSISLGGANHWFRNSTFPNGTPSYTSPSFSYRDTIPLGNAGTNSYFMTNSFDCSGATYVAFQFNHICKIPAAQRATIEVSIDGGISWTRLGGTHYKTNFYRPGTSPFFGQPGKDYFSSVAYPAAWFPGQATRIPDSTWWKNEVFDISDIATNQADVRLRFKLTNFDGNGASTREYGWLIDDIDVEIAITSPPIISQASTNAGSNTLGPFHFQFQIPSSGVTCCNFVNMFYTVNGGPVYNLPLVNNSADLWTCSIFPLSHLDTVNYYVSVSNFYSVDGFYPAVFIPYSTSAMPFSLSGATNFFVAIDTLACLNCTPRICYTRDSLNPNLYTFYDTTIYSSAPTSSDWQVNGTSYGSDSSITVTLTSGIANVCRMVSVTGCSSNCTNSCLNVAVPDPPAISIYYFNTDSMNNYCKVPQTVFFYVFGSMIGYPTGDSLMGIHVNFDDGTDTSFLTMNPQLYFYTLFSHVYQNPGTYNPQLIVYSPDSVYIDTSIIFTPFIISNTCGPVSGHVYLDINQNCVYDAGDKPLANRGVSLSNGSGVYKYTYTELTGAYSFNVPTGSNYSIEVDTSGNFYSGDYSAVCPASGSLTVNTVPSGNHNFFLVCPVGFDISTYITGWGFVPGRNGYVCLYPFDDRCSNPNGQIMMILDTLFTILPDSANYTIHGDTVIWNISGGSGNGYFQSLCVDVITSTMASIGDSVCVTAILAPIVGDAIPANNTITQCWPVRTSYDPNDKETVPEGTGASHAILPQTELTYTIRFQNTGTASAQDIFILDSLDANFDLNTLEVLAASHQMVPTILNGNILRFSFDNINLPDSNENESMSHGYVMYKITPAAGLANGTALHNTAGIYFDYNPAVITNTTLHTIDITLGVHQAEMRNNLMTVYPNPANNMLYVKLVKPGITDLNIYDVTGRTVLHQKMTESGSIDVKFLPAGSYKIQVLRTEGIQNASFMIVR